MSLSCRSAAQKYFILKSILKILFYFVFSKYFLGVFCTSLVISCTKYHYLQDYITVVFLLCCDEQLLLSQKLAECRRAGWRSGVKWTLTCCSVTTLNAYLETQPVVVLALESVERRTPVGELMSPRCFLVGAQLARCHDTNEHTRQARFPFKRNRLRCVACVA